MLKIIFLSFAISLNAQSSKEITFEDAIVEKVTSVYDGDTFRANIRDYPKIIGERIPIRIKGIDTPELKAKCEKEKQLAQQAKAFTVSMLRNAKVIKLKNLQREKYFRILADVYVDDISIGSELLKNNLAIIYDGGTKSDWCKKEEK